MNNLTLFGWNESLFQLKQTSSYSHLFHGRVSTVNKTNYEVVSENGLLSCELTGNLLFGKPLFELPCTGDWVIFQPFDEGKGIIVDILPRTRILYRRKSDTVSDKQAIASHIDKAFIVQGLDANFNPRRTERFMVQVLEENIQPILIFTKSDLKFNRQDIEDSLKHIISKVPVFFTSIYSKESIVLVRESIRPGETVVFVGSSGVGKSSLVNALCEQTVFLTSEISNATGKGRHTSTRREMVLMNGSGVLIDTPGVREFGVTVDTPEALEGIFDISGFARSCRFDNCTHTTEPGCAVKDAVDKGLLEPDVYDSYLKLRKESWNFSASEHEKRKRDKSFSKIGEEAKRIKKR
ncbi:ribosome small subunit-dependent GTPase A [Chryseobacterium populi]|uniref:Small ribosomal subunit biogenesis GTPase RsgA n=1 Tax=Chryseobacterium populi TaxID=1144316 RepID=J2KF77_9FLAO|nr:ribosome small subunit-dependent GTPase A [Chryseobacterium populi]EJL71793.1 ribosome small subunit-dependent GTPase A [Chryseobacterium populi]